MDKHIFSVNAIRDKMTIKPNYYDFTRFMNKGEDDAIDTSFLEGVKTIMNQEHTKMIARIDKLITPKNCKNK